MGSRAREPALKSRRRDRLQILADILNVASRPTKVTRILRYANVNFYSFREWSRRLIEAGLLKVNEDGFYETTEKGAAWLLKIHRIYEDLQLEPTPLQKNQV